MSTQSTTRERRMAVSPALKRTITLESAFPGIEARPGTPAAPRLSAAPRVAWITAKVGVAA
jgi:hypothetical protein